MLQAPTLQRASRRKRATDHPPLFKYQPKPHCCPSDPPFKSPSAASPSAGSPSRAAAQPPPVSAQPQLPSAPTRVSLSSGPQCNNGERNSPTASPAAPPLPHAPPRPAPLLLPNASPPPHKRFLSLAPCRRTCTNWGGELCPAPTRPDDRRGRGARQPMAGLRGPGSSELPRSGGVTRRRSSGSRFPGCEL